MRNLIGTIISAVLICTTASAAASGGEAEPTLTYDCGTRNLPVSENVGKDGGQAYSWYCRHVTGGEIPECDPDMKFIEDEGGYYVDRTHSDPESADRVIYLTFDAGYENGNVAKILDTLRDRDVKGAFFILENLITHDTELVRRMADEGHTVCNHTAKHRDMTKVVTKEEFSSELSALEKVYKEYIGCEMAHFYRPPEGKFTHQNIVWARELGYSTVMWSFAYADWDNDCQMSPERAKRKVLAGTHNGEIILLHPTSATNAAILGDLIDSWHEMGYRFGELSELSAQNSDGAES